MKRKELQNVLASLKSLSNLEGEFKYGYAVSKNVGNLESEIKTIVGINKVSEGAKKFEEERMEKLQGYLLKDKDGKSVITNGQTQFDETKMPEWKKVYDGLRKKYKKELDIEDARAKEYKEYLEGESEFTFYMVNEKECIKVLAKEMKPEQAKALSYIIKVTK